MVKSHCLSHYLTSLFIAAIFCLSPAGAETTFKPVQTQFIAAIGNPLAGSGDNAEGWGVWRQDPGPRGVRLSNFQSVLDNGGVTPAAWTYQSSSWWLEEHGLVMETPAPGIDPGRYMVTGDRATTTVLTISPKDKNGHQHWQLADGAVLYDVTHLRCRSARYTPETATAQCTPDKASQDAFPVDPGAGMPEVPGCKKEDHAVLFIVGIEE
jgi:hypothetical protein